MYFKKFMFTSCFPKHDFILTWNDFFWLMKLHIWNLLQNDIHPFLLLFCFLSSSVILGATKWGPNFFTFIFVTFQMSWPPISGQLFWWGAVFPDTKNLSPKGWFPYLIMWHFFEQFVQNRQKYATKNTW